MECKNVTDLEHLDLQARTAHFRLRLDWFRAIHHYELPNHEWHRHASLEIHFVKEGRVCFQFEQTMLEVKAGEAIIIPAMQPHKLENQSGQVYFRYVFSADIEPEENDVDALLVKAALEREHPTCVQLDEHMLALLDSSLEEAQQKEAGFMSIVECNLVTLLMLLTRQLSSAQPVAYRVHEKRNLDKQRLDQILAMLDRMSFGAARIGDIADCMHLSSRQVQRIVKAQTGMSTKRLIMRARMRQAKELLREPGLSTEYIANELGFSSAQSFSRFFRQTSGETPSHYRHSSVT